MTNRAPLATEMSEQAKPSISMGTFNVEGLKKVIDLYKERKYVEDLTYINDTLGGIGNLMTGLETSLDKGIAASSVEDRRKKFGTHMKDPPERTGFCTMLLEALDDFMLKILIGCAVFQLIIEMSTAEPEDLSHAWIEGFAILLAVAVVSLVGAGSDYKKEGQFLKQQEIAEESKKVTIRRDSEEKIMHKENIVVGDIIKIVNGMDIPVDGICVEASGVLADESSLTGESDHLQKETVVKCNDRQKQHEEDDPKSRGPHDVPSPVLLSGTQIQTGQGWFLCIVVGDLTAEGQILAAVEAKPKEVTPLQEKLDVIACDIGRIGMYAALLIFHLLVARNLVEAMAFRKFSLFEKPEECKMMFKQAATKDETKEMYVCDGQIEEIFKGWFEFIIIGVAIVVVAVPEGLPLAVMISLAYSVQKMLIDQNFVKKLSSCETMGGANNICSDKTGTLTKNQMTWTDIWSGEANKITNPDGKLTELLDTSKFSSKNTMDLLHQAVACNTLDTIDNSGATEKAMLKFISRCNCDYLSLRNRFLPAGYLRYQFDSARKRMSTVITLDEGEPTEHDYNLRLHVKGASEIILETCSHYLDKDGNKQPISDEVKEQLYDTIKNFAKQALRTIAFAYKDLKSGEGGPTHEEMSEVNPKIGKIEEGGLTLIAIAGIKDIIREEVPKAVSQCNFAGVRVRMVTGDNKITAIAIAKECGILAENEGEEENVCMEGPEFYNFVGGLIYKDTQEEVLIMGLEDRKDQETVGDIEKMKIIRNKLKVLARSRPNDKYVIVSGLRQLGDIVAVTGDGTNDAPALRKADVGFAMASGTQVAHAASDIIIQDDNFASIVKACSWGRNVYDNIRRFLQFQLSVNVVALFSCLIGSLAFQKSPLAAIQLLWVNLIMDSLASLALATETPKPELLQRPPYRKQEYIISRKMVKHILGQAIFQSIVILTFLFAGTGFIAEEFCGAGSKWEGMAGADHCDSPTREAMSFTNIQELIQKDNPKYYNELVEQWNEGKFNVLMGMLQDTEQKPMYKAFESTTPSRHLTIVFNLFVFMQIFNMICSRKINDQINIFEGITTNPAFLVVWTIIVIVQICCCQLFGRFVSVHINGLTSLQWVYSIVISFVTFPINLLLKFVPDTMCPVLGDEDPKDVEEAAKDYDILRTKGQQLLDQNPAMATDAAA